MKKTILNIHKYIGLATGIVVFIVSVTGCLWVFKDEIQSFYKPEFVFEKENKPVITATRAKEIALTEIPGKNVHGTLYKKQNDVVEVIFYEADPEFYSSVFLHPYSGEVLHVEDHLSGFFHFVLEGHMTLWLPEKIGENIVAFSVLLFMIILLTGLILWWPKENNRRQRFKFVWKESTRWRRKNFDLHAIIGFYIYLFAFLMAFTGSIMAYDWFYYIVFKSAGGEKAPQFMIPTSKNNNGEFRDSANVPMDLIIPKLQKENPQAVSFELHYPYTDSSSVYIEISNSEGVYYNSDYRFFDQYTLEEVNTPGIYGKYADADFADKIIRMNYDIHVGAIGGLAGKILAFIISLITATLPVSGFLLWFGRKNKKKQ